MFELTNGAASVSDAMISADRIFSRSEKPPMTMVPIIPPMSKVVASQSDT